MIFNGGAKWRNPHFCFVSLMEEYLARELTHDNDILRAAMGMLARLESICRVRTVEGMFPRFHLSILFRKDGADSVSTRRPEFPSYSWTGWKYVATWKGTRFGNQFVGWGKADSPESINAVTHIVWYCLSSNGNFYKLDEKGVHTPSLPPDPDFHRLFPPTSLRISELIKSAPVSPTAFAFKACIPCPAYTLLCFWAICIRFKLRMVSQPKSRPPGLPNLESEYEVVGKNGTLCGLVTLDCGDLSISEVHEFALVTEFRGWKDDSQSLQIWWCSGLLLKWNGAIAERRGLLHMFENGLDPSLSFGMEWKAVTLS